MTQLGLCLEVSAGLAEHVKGRLPCLGDARGRDGDGFAGAHRVLLGRRLRKPNSNEAAYSQSGQSANVPRRGPSAPGSRGSRSAPSDPDATRQAAATKIATAPQK